MVSWGFHRHMPADGWLVDQASEQMWEPTQGGPAHTGTDTMKEIPRGESMIVPAGAESRTYYWA